MGTKSGNFSGSMSGGITYDVSFTSSMEMDDDYDYDDNLIQDYVEELIRDDGSRKSIQEFDFVMGSGWYSGSHINGTVTWWTGNYSAETFEAQEYGNNCDDCGGFLRDCIGHTNGKPCNQVGVETRLCSKCGDGPRCDSCRKIYHYYGGDDPYCNVCDQMVPYNPISNVGESHKRWCKWDAGAGQTAGTCETCWSEPWMWSNDLGYVFFDEDSPYYNTDYDRMCLHCMKEDFPEVYEHLVNQPAKVSPTPKKKWQFWKSEDFEAPSYGSYYGACLLPDGSCTETSLDMCRALGGRFQGPGTSCYPDAGWARPRVMQAENMVSSGIGKGFAIGVVAGIISGLVTTVFGTVISEILLDRLREDPELEITEEDPGTNTPHL